MKHRNISFEYPKKSLLKPIQKNTFQNFSTQKNPEIENFKPPKILRDHPCHLKTGLPPWEYSTTQFLVNLSYAK